MNTANITVNTQSSIRIDGSKVLYFDPFQIASQSHDADLVFITHSHYDHFDPESVGKVSKADTVFIAPAGMEQEIRKAAGDAELILMEPGDTRDVSGISVKTVPAYNRLKPFHPKRNGWCGYVVTMDGGRYYVAGDTDAINELSSVKCDVALVPIGGTYTMNAKDAAKLVNEIRPAVVIPTHYGSIVGKPEDARAFRKYVDQAIVVETRL
jgi:L-ascorbate metabolism protein UlaG (beta-lactamase superfamily)